MSSENHLPAGDFELTIFGNTAREVLTAGGTQYTPNDYVDTLYELEYDPRNPCDLTLKIAGVVAAIECADLLDEEHHQKLLTIAELAFCRGQECLEG